MYNLDPNIQKTIEKSVLSYKGAGVTLESALGAITIGRLYGWRVLKMMHSPASYRNYEKILGVKFEDTCPETTEHSKRNLGYKLAEKLKSFWAVARGSKTFREKGHFS